jgi:hypothetical protein
MNTNRSRLLATLIAAAATLALMRTATAGLPLLCHPLDPGKAEVLPWGSGWQSPDPRYDVSNLQGDVERLLSGEAPILARMENLRRAALYTAEKPKLASALVATLVGRAAKQGPANRLAWFDAAYLIETYRQVDMTFERGVLGRVARPATAYPELNALDGYRMLGTLLAREGESAELEFARGLMMRDGTEQRHLKRAAQLAPHDSALARNVALFLR